MVWFKFKMYYNFIMNSRIKVNLFSIASALMMVYYFIGSANILSERICNALYSIAFVVFVSIAIIDFIYKPLNKKSLLLITVFLILSLIMSSISKRMDIYLMLIIGLAFRDIDVDSFLIRDAITKTIITILVVTKALNTMTVDASFFTRRQALGFGHPNSLGMMMTLIAIELMVVSRKNKIARVLSYFFSIAILFINNFVCQSRTSFIVLLIALICFVLLQFKENIMKLKLVQFVISNLFLICTGISALLVYIYKTGSELGLTLNQLFSTRLELAAHYLDLYKLNLFGNNPTISNEPFTYEGVFYYVVDMGYIWIPLIYGVVGVILFALIYNLTIKKLFKNNQYHHVVLLILMFIYCFMENTFIKYRFNVFIILLAYGFLYFEKEDKKEYVNRYVLTMFISLFACCAIFHNAICNNDSLFFLANDTNIIKQYALMENYYLKMHSMSFSQFDWTLGLGNSFYSLIKDGLLSPFNLLILPFSKDILPQICLYLNIFKIIFLSLTSCLWLGEITKDRFKTISISILVTFSGIIVLFWESGFFDCFVLFPLCLYFVEKYIESDKILGLVASLIVIFFTNCVYAIPLATFLIIYYLLRTNDYKKALKYILIVLCSVGLTIFAMIPSFAFLQTGESNFIEMLSNAMSSSYALGAMLCFGVSIFFINDNKKKIKYGIGFVAMLIASVLLTKQFQDVVLFIPYFYVCLMMSESFTELENKYFPYLIELSVFVVFIFTGLFTNKFDIDIVLKQCALVVVSIIAIIILKSYTMEAITLVVLTAALLSANIYISNEIGTPKRFLKDTNYSSLSVITSDDKGLYRIINDDGADKNVNKGDEYYLMSYTYSDVENNIPGVLNNIGDFNLESKEIIDLLNKKNDPNEYMGFNKNEISFFNLFGTKYWYSSDTEKKCPSYYSKVSGKDYYVNDYYIELGYVNNKTINSNYLRSLSLFEQEKVLREYVALEESNNNNYELISSYDLTMLEDYTYEGLLVHEFEEPIDNVTLVINSGGIPTIDAELYMDDVLVKTEHYYSYDFCNAEVDSPINKIIVKYDNVDGVDYGIRLFMTTPNKNNEELVYNQRSQNCFKNVVFDNNKISANINANEDDSLVYTYIPFDLNWGVYVDGYHVDVLKANYGFISFRVDRGEHDVEFIYEVNNSLNLLSPISLCGLLGIIGVDIFKKRKTNSK